MQSPFKLFEPYGAQDKHLFFGRDAEVYALYNLLQQTRLVLVYGASGTGKTSLLQAGLPKVFKLSDWFRISVRRRDNLNASLRAELKRLGDGTPVTDLAAGVEAVYDTRWIPIYLVFDQFEELFTLGHHEERVQFFRDLQTLLERPLPCKIVLSMREEYIGHLYEYEPLVPSLFDKRFRVEPMKDETVRQVVARTCEAHGVTLAEGAITAGQILEQVKEGKQAAHLPYLQVYLHYLYEQAMQTTGQPRFEAAGIKAVGQLGNVLKRFIETQLDDARRHFAALGLPDDFANRLLDEFATSEGTKQAQRAADLAQILDAPENAVAEALAWFTEKKLLRADEDDVTRYEPVHDVVAKQILALRTAEDKEYKAFVRQLENDCARWLADGQNDERLLKENDLAKVELYLERLVRRSAFTAEWQDFVARSRAHLGAQARRRRRRQQVTAAAAVLGFGLAGLATIFYIKANAATREAQKSLCSAWQEQYERYALQAKQAKRDAATFQKAGETQNEVRKIQDLHRLDSLMLDLKKKLKQCGQ